jgi:imidazoleglycerol-phosphate dehydratase
MRKAELSQKTSETNIKVAINLDGSQKKKINTGIGFFDHMLELFVFHSYIDLEVSCQGDLSCDQHHSIEDTAIVLGRAIKKALGDKTGIQRYASFYLPMDEALTLTNLDISGRFTHIFFGSFEDQLVGLFPTQMAQHFFYTLACNAGFTLHQNILYGKNDHHKIESLFKGFAKAFQSAIIFDEKKNIPSSKGLL